jgi:hypothetical protein
MLGKITSNLLDKCFVEFNKEENQDKIKINIIDPIIEYIKKRVQPYLIFILFLFILMIFLTIGMIILIFLKMK